MSEQITWTHVDKLVRKMHDDKGMLPVGLTDAKVAHAFIQWLDKRNVMLIQNGVRLEQRCDQLEVELRKIRNEPKSKTKQRLAALEEDVADLRNRLDNPPRECSISGCTGFVVTTDGYCREHA